MMLINLKKILVYLAYLLPCVALLGCNEQAQKLEKAQAVAKSPATQERIQALLRKSTADLVFVEGGGFWMGDFGVLMDARAKQEDIPPRSNATPGDNLPFTVDEDNKPPKWVNLDGYSMQKYKVTYDDFDVYVAANALPAHPPEGEDTFHRVWRKSRTSGDVPAGVTWHQAKSYCRWLAQSTGLPFDLPTEAQWEYAASARTNSYRHPYPTQTGLLKENVTHPSHEKKKELTNYKGTVYPVGRFAPSKLGFYDLVGNGFDWIDDWYAADTYKKGPSDNPRGPDKGTLKVARGMSTGDGWMLGFPHLSRYGVPPEGEPNPDGGTYAPTQYGFRCVVNQPQPVVLQQ